MTIDKNYLEDFETLNLIFCEECEFKIPVKEVTDLHLEISETPHPKYNFFRVLDGYFKISAKGGEIPYAEYDEELGDEFTLKERINQCFNLSYVVLEQPNGEKFEFKFQYDPLYESITQREVEFSNCPSCEIDEDGTISVFVGNSSKNPKRTDNNFDELIEGWCKKFHEYKPDTLKVDVTLWRNYESKDLTQDFVFDLTILNKRVKNGQLYLVCLDCTHHSFRISSYLKEEIELNMSRLKNGNIFVDFVGYGLTFECKRVEADKSAELILYD